MGGRGGSSGIRATGGGLVGGEAPAIPNGLIIHQTRMKARQFTLRLLQEKMPVLQAAP